jgi:hypothetical protein
MIISVTYLDWLLMRRLRAFYAGIVGQSGFPRLSQTPEKFWIYLRL